MKTLNKQTETNEGEMLDDYSHLKFKRAGNRFAKYRNGNRRIFVIDEDGTEHQLTKEEMQEENEGVA